MHKKALDAAKDPHIQGAKECAALSRTTTSNHDTFAVHSLKPVSDYVVVFIVSTCKAYCRAAMMLQMPRTPPLKLLILARQLNDCVSKTCDA